MLIAMEGSSKTIFGENNRKYYVWEAYQETTHAAKYIGGPAAISWGLSGVNIRTMANDATEFIRGNSGSIFLIGWSRGAAACIQVALDLQRSGYSQNVEALFLFDPVDQDGSTRDFLNFIPGNVRNCYLAQATQKEGADGWLFPTCGQTYAPNVNYVKRNFNTTHGGIAGTQGRNGDAGARGWMWGHMTRHGLL